MTERTFSPATLPRRRFLAGAATVALLPAAARAAPGDTELRAALDSLSQLGSPEAKLVRLAPFEVRALSPSAQIDLETVRAGLAIDARLITRFPVGRLGRSPYRVSPTAGAWRDADSRDPVEWGHRIAEDNAAIEADAARGVILPQLLLDKTAAAIDTAAAKADGPAAARLREQAALLASLRPRAPAEPGVARFPGGTDYFALLLERHFGAAIAPETAHRQLHARLTETLSRADAVLRRLGMTQGSVGARIRTAFRDPRFLYSDDEAGRDDAVRDMNAWLARVRPRLPALFGALPSECLDVATRRMTPAEVAAGKQGYRVVPTPGAQGSYFVDLQRIRDRPSWTLPSVVHHELLPGHMVQLPIEAAAHPHPLRLDYVPAFAEGWAIYAEQLMARDGAYAGQDRALLGHLHWQLFRLARATVDTGVHLGHYTVKDASAKLDEWQGEAVYFAPLAQDLERICIEPAMRAAEALTGLALAERGQRHGAPGSQTLRAFHRSVLAHGRKRFAMIA